MLIMPHKPNVVPPEVSGITPTKPVLPVTLHAPTVTKTLKLTTIMILLDVSVPPPTVPLECVTLPDVPNVWPSPPEKPPIP